mgnify:CR=1 FL=1
MKNNHELQGVFKANSKGFGFVKIDGEDEEIFISSINTKKALNGDIVKVKVYEYKNNDKEKTKNTDKTIIQDKIEKENLHREGKIIEIVKHEKNTLVGTFQKSKNFGFVVPDDRKFGTDIFISKSKFNGASDKSKVLVGITKYDPKGKKPEGEILEVIGKADESGVDMLSLVKEYNLPYEFPDTVISEAKKVSKIINNNETRNRLDLRDKEIFTIDGEDAKDLDDAIYIEKTDSGKYILGVHIADVSAYVKEGSDLDNEAIIRGTSVYMMDRVIPMLPKELSNGICSLNAKEDRLSLSAIMEIDSQGKVISSDIRKSIIRVTERMSYNDVSVILKSLNKEECTNDEIQIVEKYKKYTKHFKTMEELAKILKAKRMKEGSLDLDVPESKIILDKNGIAINVKKYEVSFANEIIEQFMLLANEVVAEKFYWLEAPFIYRVHEEPDIEKINELNKFLYNLGYKIKASKENIHPKAFSEVLEQVKGKPEDRVVSNLILRTLKVARYENENKGHFGIASKYYCHFTSPIRRYPDLFIHRIISKYLDENYLMESNDVEKYTNLAIKYSESSSIREKIAQKVERDSVDIKKAEFMQSKIGQEFDGIISNITSFGAFVELENTVEGLIRFENLGKEYFEYNETRKTLIGEKTKKVYKIGDKVKIKVIEANKELRRVSFEIVDKVQNIWYNPYL